MQIITDVAGEQRDVGRVVRAGTPSTGILGETAVG
jgi:hypothetical protein